MPNELMHTSLADLFSDIADVIRYKRSDLSTNPEDPKYQELIADQFDEEILDIVTLEEGTAGDTAVASDLLSGKTAHTAGGTPITGTMANAVITSGAGSATISNPKYNSTTGKFDQSASGTVAAPTVGTAGYVSSTVGTKNTNTISGSKSLDKINLGVNVVSLNGNTVTPVISRTAKPDGDTWIDAASGAATTTKPTTAKPYVRVDSAAKTTTLNISPKVTSEGYGTQVDYGSTGKKESVGASASAATYVPILEGSASTPTGKEAVITPSFSLDATTGKVTVTGSATVSVTPTTTAGYIAANSGSAADVTGKIKTTENANVYDLGVGTATTPSGKKATITPSFSFDDTTGVVTVTGSNTVSVTPTTTAGYIKANAGVAANVTGEIASTGNTYSVGLGSATTPTDSITKNPTIEWDSTAGKIKASYSGSKSITPTTTAGYIAADSGTAGTISTSGTTSVTVASLDSEFKAANIAKGATIFGVDGSYTSDANAAAGDILKNKTAYVNGSKITGTIESKAAATYYPSSDDQEIAASQYLSGKQTIKAVTTSGISAANIKSGATVKVGDAADDDRITSVDGTFSASSTVTGTGVTAASAGDILLNKAAFLNGAQITGEMPNQGAKTPTITTQGGTWTIPAGYHNGSGYVTANITASTLDDTIIGGSAYEEATDDYAWKTTVNIPAGYHEAQTIEKTYSSVFPAPDTEGTSGEVLLGYELFDHDGKKITGTMPNNSATGGTITTQGGTYSIPAGYTTGGTVTANIDPGAHSAVATKVSNASAQIDANGFTAASSNTTHYVTLTTGNGSAKATSKIDTGGYLAQDTTGVDSASNATIGVTVGNNGVTRINIPDGGHSAVATKVSDATAGISANGFTAAGSNTTHYVTLTTSAGSAKATSKIDTAGYLNKDTTGVDSATNATVGVTVTDNITRINIPDGAHSATATKVSAGSASIAASSNVPTTNTDTGYYIELTTSSGYAKATSKIDTAGYLNKDTTGVDSASNVEVNVTGNGSKIYLDVETALPTTGDHASPGTKTGHTTWPLSYTSL